MNKRQERRYLSDLGLIMSEFDDSLLKLGEKIRQEIIVPLCKKHNLKFLSGNGIFFFTDLKGHDYADPWPLASRASKGNLRIYNATKSVLLLLNTEVSHNQVLGYFVSDVP